MSKSYSPASWYRRPCSECVSTATKIAIHLDGRSLRGSATSVRAWGILPPGRIVALGSIPALGWHKRLSITVIFFEDGSARRCVALLLDNRIGQFLPVLRKKN